MTMTRAIKIPSEIEKLFGRRLAQKREEAGLSQRDLARTLKITAPAISMWETGKSTPNADTLVTLSSLYDVSLDWLFGIEHDAKRRLRYQEGVSSVPVLDILSLSRWSFDSPRGRVQTEREYRDETKVAGLDIDFTTPLPSQIQKGDVLIVERVEVADQEGVYVIKAHQSHTPIIRRAVREGDAIYFAADDQRIPFVSADEAIVLGRATEVVRRSKVL